MCGVEWAGAARCGMCGVYMLCTHELTNPKVEVQYHTCARRCWCVQSSLTLHPPLGPVTLSQDRAEQNGQGVPTGHEELV